jgi:hypothetical protein
MRSSWHTRPRVQRAPGIPCALSSGGGNEFGKSSGKSCREIANVYSVVIVREGGRSSIPEAAMIEPIGRGVLDAPPSRGMTTDGCLKIESKQPFLPSPLVGEGGAKRRMRGLYPRRQTPHPSAMPRHRVHPLPQGERETGPSPGRQRRVTQLPSKSRNSARLATDIAQQTSLAGRCFVLARCKHPRWRFSCAL